MFLLEFKHLSNKISLQKRAFHKWWRLFFGRRGRCLTGQGMIQNPHATDIASKAVKRLYRGFYLWLRGIVPS